jgi:hypothetical protein
MHFKKDLAPDSPTPSSQDSKFVLVRYRSEHNHPLDYVAEFGYGPE